jgi:uncharacterized protein (TIGR02452 family)
MDIHQWRVEVYNETKQIAKKYKSKESQKYVYDSMYIFPLIYNHTTIEVTPEDTIVAGLRLKSKGMNPLLLNFANDVHPGGGVEHGCGAQEESLFRRTNLYNVLPTRMYPIRANEAIYSPDVTVFRDTEKNQYTLMNPQELSFIAAPGLNHPPLTKEGSLTPAQERYFEEKILLIFQVAKKNHHDSLVLGPLGCGAWRCPPQHVAQIFKKTCAKLNGLFAHITFACYSRPELPDTNFTVFSNVFSHYT